MVFRLMRGFGIGCWGCDDLVGSSPTLPRLFPDLVGDLVNDTRPQPLCRQAYVARMNIALPGLDPGSTPGTSLANECSFAEGWNPDCLKCVEDASCAASLRRSPTKSGKSAPNLDCLKCIEDARCAASMGRSVPGLIWDLFGEQLDSSPI